MIPSKWVERDCDLDLVRQLAQDLGLPLAVVKVLLNRGISSKQQAEAYFKPHFSQLPLPHLFKGMPEAVHRLGQALFNGETIGIFGDYDVDGVASTTMLWEFLEQLGAKAVATLPNRLLEGYGLSHQGVERLHQQGATLIVTVDCGITANEQVEKAAQLGIDVIIVDHHTVPVTIPKATAIINPHQKDCFSNRTHLCAAGVVFNLCASLRSHLREKGFFTKRQEPPLHHLLDLLAVATVADVMPLKEDNRIFVAKGIESIKTGKRLGLQMLLKAAQIDPNKITAGTLGFHIGPRLNAAGRLEDAMTAVKLLRNQNPEEALELAYLLDSTNETRKNHEKETLQEAIQQIDNSSFHRDSKTLVVASESWHPGVVGIVASRLVERYGKPSIVIGSGGKGSGRSIPAFHLHEALTAVSQHLIGFGGHAHAVGVHVDLAILERFQSALSSYAEQVLTSDDMAKIVYHDGVVEPKEINHTLIQQLEQLQPFGRGNPEPLFLLEDLRLEALKPLANNHVKGVVRKGTSLLPFIAFGLGDKVASLSGNFSALAVPEFNEWRGEKSLQLRIKEMGDNK